MGSQRVRHDRATELNWDFIWMKCVGIQPCDSPAATIHQRKTFSCLMIRRPAFCLEGDWSSSTKSCSLYKHPWKAGTNAVSASAHKRACKQESPAENCLQLLLHLRCLRGLGTWYCSHVFWETNSLRRTMQRVECSLLQQGPKAESPLSQGVQPVFVKTLYTLSVRAQTHLPKFPETSLNKGKERYKKKSKLTRDSYSLILGS